MTPPIKIGLIGCGRISKNHFDVISELPNLKLVAVCDENPTTAKEKGTLYKVPAYSDPSAFFEHEMDIVTICTPSGLHPIHGIMAAQKGIHVITEKPMAVKLEDGKALVKACKDNQVKLFVVKQNRLNPTIKLLKKAIEKGRFGKIYMATTNVFWTRPQSYYDQAKWRGTWAMDGGAFMNQASHYVDLIQWLVGDVQSVFATTKTFEREIEAEDTGIAVLEFKNGAIGSIQVTMLTYPKNYEGSITILGEKGTVKIGGTSVNEVEKWEFEDHDDDDNSVTQADTHPPTVYGFGHKAYYENVIDCLLGTAEADTDGNEGLKSLMLLDAIYRANQTQEKVTLQKQWPLNE